MIKKIFFSLASVIFCNLALAERPSFNYVEVGKTDLEHELVTGDFTGFEIAGSYELKDNFFIAVKYVSTNDLGLDMETKTVGIGYHQQLLENTVLVAQVDAVGVIFSRPNSGVFDEQGKQFSLGIKSNIFDSLEVELTMKRLDVGEVDETYGNYRIDYTVLGLHYKFTNNLAFYADFEKEDNSERVAFGIRYEY